MAISTTLNWHPVTERLPDSDTTVLCWLATGEWFSGWYEDEDGDWFDAATGADLSNVTHWAEPAGPTDAPAIAQAVQRLRDELERIDVECDAKRPSLAKLTQP